MTSENYRKLRGIISNKEEDYYDHKAFVVVIDGVRSLDEFADRFRRVIKELNFE